MLLSLTWFSLLFLQSLSLFFFFLTPPQFTSWLGYGYSLLFLFPSWMSHIDIILHFLSALLLACSCSQSPFDDWSNLTSPRQALLLQPTHPISLEILFPPPYLYLLPYSLTACWSKHLKGRYCSYIGPHAACNFRPLKLNED